MRVAAPGLHRGPIASVPRSLEGPSWSGQSDFDIELRTRSKKITYNMPAEYTEEPPICACFSTTNTFAPDSAANAAHANPDIPPPQTRTSTVIVSIVSRWPWTGYVRKKIDSDSHSEQINRSVHHILFIGRGDDALDA